MNIFKTVLTSRSKNTPFRTTFTLISVVTACILQAQTAPPVLWMYQPIQTGYCQAFSHDGSKLYVAGERGVQIFNPSTRKVLGCLPTTYPIVEALAISPDGTTLALGGNTLLGGQGAIELWNLSSSKLLRTISTAAPYVTALAFSANGKLLAEGGDLLVSPGYPVQVFDVATGAVKLSPVVSASTINSVQFSKDGNTLAIGGVGSSGIVEILSSSTGLPVQIFKTSSATVNSVSFSPSGTSLVVGGSTPNTITLTDTGYLEIWNVATGQLSTTVNTACQSVNSLQFSPDGKLLAIGVYPTLTRDGSIQVWNASNWKQVGSFNNSAQSRVLSVLFSPNGKLISDIEGFTFTGVNLWSASSFALNGKLNLGIYAPTSSTAFSLDSKTLISGSGGQNPTGSSEIFYGLLQYSDALTGNLVKAVKTPNYVSSVAVSPNGKLLAACGQNMTNSTLELRDPASGKLITTLSTLATDQYYQVAFSRDGSMVAASRSVVTNTGYQNVEVWSVPQHKLIETLATEMTGQVGGMSFSADGSVLAVGGTGYSGQAYVGEMQLWNVSNGTLITPLYPSIYFINAVQYSPDGTQLAIGGITYDVVAGAANGSVEIWNPASESKDLVLKMPPASAAVTSLAYSKDGNVIYAGSKIGVQSFDTANGLILENDVVGSVNGLSVSPDGTLLSFSSYIPLIGVLQSPITSVILSSPSIAGGHSLKGTVTLANPAPAAGVQLSLFSNTSAVTFPSTVTVAAGKSSATFSVSTLSVPTQEIAAISAFLGGYSQSASLTIQGPSLTSLSINPPAVKGGVASSGTISISVPAPTGGIVISVSSNSPSAVVPQTVTIPAGKTSGTFSIGTAAVKSKTQVGISVRLGSATQTKFLTIS